MLIQKKYSRSTAGFHGGQDRFRSIQHHEVTFGKLLGLHLASIRQSQAMKRHVAQLRRLRIGSLQSGSFGDVNVHAAQGSAEDSHMSGSKSIAVITLFLLHYLLKGKHFNKLVSTAKK